MEHTTTHLVTTSHVDHIDDIVSELTGVICSKVVAARLNKQQLGLELVRQLLQGQEVGRDVFTDRSMRAAALG